jgi:hypothetical protein
MKYFFKRYEFSFDNFRTRRRGIFTFFEHHIRGWVMGFACVVVGIEGGGWRRVAFVLMRSEVNDKWKSQLEKLLLKVVKESEVYVIWLKRILPSDSHLVSVSNSS